MRHPWIGSAAAITALAVGAGALPALATSEAHHRHHRLRLVVVPAHPRHGQKVRLYVAGTTLGGRYYGISGGSFGNGSGFHGGPSCAAGGAPVKEYREPIALHYGYRWQQPGTYRVVLTIDAFCVRPALPERTVRTTVTVG